MKIARFLVAALLAAPAALVAQEGIATFKYTVHAQSGNANPNGESRVYFSPTAMRIELQMNIGASADNRARARAANMPTTFKTTMIQKLSDPDKLYTLNDERHTYSVTNLSEMRQSTPAEQDTYTVKRMGSDRIAGVSCEKATVTSSKGNQIEVCVTNEIAASSSWLAAMNRRPASHGNWLKAMMDAGLKGFPIRMKFHGQETGGDEITMELSSLEKKPVSSALFQIPVGYSESNTSTVNMSAEQEKRMQEMLSKMTPEQRKAYEDAMKAQGKKQ